MDPILPPGVEPDEPPFVCLKINQYWIPFITGALVKMIYPEYWSGSIEENRIARRQAVNLIGLFQDAGENCPEGDDMRLRHRPDNDCIIQASYDGGDTWEDMLDIAAIKTCLGLITQRIITNQRYNSNGYLEVSYDGGETWEIDRIHDPRFTSQTFPYPYADADDPRCSAAYSGERVIKDMIDEIVSKMNLSSTLVQIITAVMALILFLLSAGGATPLVMALVATALAGGVAAIEAAFTQGVYDTVRCILYCNALEDGSFDEAGWQQCRADVGEQLTGIAATMLIQQLDILGPVGLTNAGRVYPDEAGTCEACECPYCATWSVELSTLCGGWNWNAYGHGCSELGAWGETFVYEGQTCFTFNAWKLVSQTTITRIKVVLNEARAVSIGTTTENKTSSPSGTEHIWNGEYSIEGQLHILLDGAAASPYVQSITVWGTGDIPTQFVGHECE